MSRRSVFRVSQMEGDNEIAKDWMEKHPGDSLKHIVDAIKKQGERIDKIDDALEIDVNLYERMEQNVIRMGRELRGQNADISKLINLNNSYSKRIQKLENELNIRNKSSHTGGKRRKKTKKK